MKYFLHLGYDGGNYHGWQQQPDVSSVQEVVEQTLARIFKTTVTAYGCGRTDAGVHASQYFLHIELEESFDFDLKFRLNKNLPSAIVIFDVLEVEAHQHARYDAISRTYDYFIHLNQDPILTRYSSYYPLKNLDMEAMKKAAAILPLHNDFKAVCKRPNLYKHTRCTVTEAKLYVNMEQERLRFTISASRFLHGMIRICVNFILKIGQGKMSLEAFDEMLATQSLTPVKHQAFPQGLYLSRVIYPYLDLKPQVGICELLKKGLEEE